MQADIKDPGGWVGAVIGGTRVGITGPGGGYGPVLGGPLGRSHRYGL